MPEEFVEFAKLLKQEEPATDADLLAAITNRVNEMMQGDIELLFSYLYRLDVEESQIDFIINKQMTIPVNEGLAKLIFDRQMARQETKKQYKQEPIDGWDDWSVESKL